MERLEEDVRKRYVPPVSIGLIHAALGDFDRAFEWFEKGIEANDTHLAFVNRSPAYEFVTKDPRWEEIRERIGL